MSEKNSDAPKIVFPCPYPMKVIAIQSDDLERQVREALLAHGIAEDELVLALLPSRNGRFVSVRIELEAQSEAHVKAMFESLKTLPGVQMVL